MDELAQHQNELEFMLDEILEIYSNDTRVLLLALKLATNNPEYYIQLAHKQINNELTNEGLN